VEKQRPDLLQLKGYIEGLPEEKPKENSAERVNRMKKITQSINVNDVLKERENSKDSKAET